MLKRKYNIIYCTCTQWKFRFLCIFKRTKCTYKKGFFLSFYDVQLLSLLIDLRVYEKLINILP
ncbi:hypothetical protein X975_14203, partial [Stegodyphus mimosarum]